MGAKSSGFSSFGCWLKVALAECGMKQKDLAIIMGTTETTVSRWVHGHRHPTFKQMDHILKYFDCHAEIVPNERS